MGVVVVAVEEEGIAKTLADGLSLLRVVVIKKLFSYIGASPLGVATASFAAEMLPRLSSIAVRVATYIPRSDLSPTRLCSHGS